MQIGVGGERKLAWCLRLLSSPPSLGPCLCRLISQCCLQADPLPRCRLPHRLHGNPLVFELRRYSDSGARQLCGALLSMYMR